MTDTDITSIVFLVFLAVCLLLYWRLSAEGQWKLLTVASIVFYLSCVSPSTFIYVLVSAGTVYYATERFCADREGKRNRLILILTLLVNAGILAVLKYTNLGIHTLNIVLNNVEGYHRLPDLNWLAPLGISYYTLQIISYLLDCYWGTADAFHDPLKMLLYTIYFPQMISGPISRFGDIGVQLFEKHEFEYDRVTRGVRRIAWGFIKKLVIANKLMLIVNHMYDHTEVYSGIWIWIATMIWVIELYADFSGCMDIVLGASACFGIQLPENFRTPFFSLSIQEFWRRWHITLGTWLRDYIMNPVLRTRFCINLGKKAKKRFGKKKGRKIPAYFAMLILWLVMGLWHGNSWKYIVGEGLWFWLVIVIGQILEEPLGKIVRALHIPSESFGWKTFQRIRTFLIFTVGQLFFRADSLMDSFSRIRNSIVYFGKSISPSYIRLVLDDLRNSDIVFQMGQRPGEIALVLSMLLMVYVDIQNYRGTDIQSKLKELPNPARWALYYCAVVLIFISFNAVNVQFAYAQF